MVFQEKVTTMIEEDREEEIPMPTIDMSGHSDGDPSCNLRAINFLCDEVLNTSVMYNFINGYKRDRVTTGLSESKPSCPPTFVDTSEYDV